mgnify:CR=1 FL=1
MEVTAETLELVSPEDGKTSEQRKQCRKESLIELHELKVQLHKQKGEQELVTISRQEIMQIERGLIEVHRPELLSNGTKAEQSGSKKEEKLKSLQEELRHLLKAYGTLPHLEIAKNFAKIGRIYKSQSDLY